MRTFTCKYIDTKLYLHTIVDMYMFVRAQRVESCLNYMSAADILVSGYQTKV